MGIGASGGYLDYDEVDLTYLFIHHKLHPMRERGLWFLVQLFFSPLAPEIWIRVTNGIVWALIGWHVRQWYLSGLAPPEEILRVTFVLCMLFFANYVSIIHDEIKKEAKLKKKER